MKDYFKNLKELLLKFFNKIPKEYLLHFLAGLIMYCFCLIVLNFLLFPSRSTSITSFSVVFFAAILKEVWYDRKYDPNNFETLDVFVTILGSLFGLIMNLLT